MTKIFRKVIKIFVKVLMIKVEYVIELLSQQSFSEIVISSDMYLKLTI